MEKYVLVFEIYLDLTYESDTGMVYFYQVVREANVQWNNANTTINRFISGGAVFGSPSLTNSPIAPGSKLSLMHKHKG